MIIRRAILALLLICVVFSVATPARADIDITDIYLLGPGGTGGTTTVPTNTFTTGFVGTSSSTFTWVAQSFSVSSGIASQLTINFGANLASPTTNLEWHFYSNNVSIPGTSLASGTFTPTANATSTIDVSAADLFLYSNTIYWVVLKPVTLQPTTNMYSVKVNTVDTYAGGQFLSSSNAGATSWTAFASQDIQLSVTTVLGSAETEFLNDKIAQSFTVGGYVTASSIKLDLKKFGSPTGEITLNIESDVGNSPSGYLIADGATGTLSESSLTTDYDLTEITLDESINLQPGIKYWIVITTDRTDSTDYVTLGSTSDCVVDQYLKVHNQGVWKSEDTTGIFEFSLSSSPEQPVSTNAANISTLGALIILIVIGFGQVYLGLRLTK